mgnify:CR=1 FL=1
MVESIVVVALLGAAALFEVAAYFFRFFDHLLDTVAGPAAVMRRPLIGWSMNER